MPAHAPTFPELSRTEAGQIIELLTGIPVNRESRSVKVLIGKGEYLLPDINIDEPHIQNHPLEFIARTGKVYVDAPVSEYEIFYAVGYREKEIPALVESLIGNLVNLFLEDSEYRVAALAELRMLKSQYNSIMEARAND